MYETIHFPSKDGLLITADWYNVSADAASKQSNGAIVRGTIVRGTIVLCHRSHCNRAEYRQTAPRLVSLGYKCLALDQRSGMKVFGETNETSKRAKEQGLATGYLAARPDIEAAVEHAFALGGNTPIVLFGSSYSASLALLLASGSHADMIASVVAFSPGEYLKGVRVAEELHDLQKPTFVTGSLKEIELAREVSRYIPRTYLTFFSPEAEGFHGSKALWDSVAGYEAYWQALERFLG